MWRLLKKELKNFLKAVHAISLMEIETETGGEVYGAAEAPASGRLSEGHRALMWDGFASLAHRQKSSSKVKIWHHVLNF